MNETILRKQTALINFAKRNERIYTPDLEYISDMKILEIIIYARVYRDEISVDEAISLSPIYLNTVKICLKNEIPLAYLRDSNGEFKKYNTRQLFAIEEGIQEGVDIRLFARDPKNSSAVMINSLHNIIEERNKKIKYRKKTYSKKMKILMARNSFERLQLKLLGVTL